MMKRCIAFIMIIALAVSLVCCKGGGDEQSATVYPSRTAAFYGNMDTESFWFCMTLTNNGYTYRFEQATDGARVTTIEDHGDNGLDKYSIYDGSCIHELNVDEKYYDTVVNLPGQEFLFGDYTPEMFANPTSTAVESFKGRSYYCETFATALSAGAATSGRNKYYYDNETLIAVERYEGGKLVMIMEFSGYSNDIPSGVYLAIPSDFKARNFVYEESAVDFSEIWGDKFN